MIIFENLNSALVSLLTALAIIIAITGRLRTGSIPWLRLLTILLVIAALTRPHWQGSSPASSDTVVLLDISDSFDEGSAQALIDSALTRGDGLSILPFAKSPNSDVINSSRFEFRKIKERFASLDIGATNIANALGQVLDQRKFHKALLVSDGQQTVGDALALLDSLKANGIQVYPIVPSDLPSANERFAISQLYAPFIVSSDRSAQIRTTVINTSSTAQRADLEITHDHQILSRKSIEIPAKSEQVFITDSANTKSGIKEVTATLTPSKRAFPVSAMTTFLAGEERQKLLILNGGIEDERLLKEIYSDRSFDVRSLVATERLINLPDLLEFKGIILNNIALDSLPPGSATRIKRFVTEGGSLLMIGGNRSFGLGGYKDSPISEVLPVELLPPQTTQKRLNIAVTLVVDQSGSMAESQKLEYAKEAARQVVVNLKDDDLLSVIGFNSTPFPVLPLTQMATSRELATERIGRLFPTGKTNLLPAIELARKALASAPAGRKHVLILTDGKLPDSGPYYVEFVKQLRLLGISVSTIMLGAEVDIELLKDMADYGGGAFYQTTDPRALPRIFLQDVKVSGGERTMQEQQDFPVRPGTSGIKSVSAESFPALRGFVQTKPRAGASLELVVQSEDKAFPLLASQKFGRGKSLAFTSDANGRWSASWARWNGFTSFWQDIARSLSSTESGGAQKIDFELKPGLRASSLVLDLAVFTPGLAQTASANIKLPDMSERQIEFTTLANGHFQATIDQALPGKYEFRGSVGNSNLPALAFSLSGESFGEKKGLGFNMPLLTALAAATKGSINPAKEQLLRDAIPITWKRDLSPFLLAIAALLFVIDILRRELGSRFNRFMFAWKH